jgi:hypothetical protein
MVVAHNEQVIGLISQRGGLKRIKVKDVLPYSRISFGKEISLTIKGNPHIIQSADTVLPSTIFLLNINNKLTEGKFNQVDITNETSSYSKFFAKSDDSLILSNITTTESINEKQYTLEERFKQAEEKVAAISQLSIEELLRKKK